MENMKTQHPQHDGTDVDPRLAGIDLRTRRRMQPLSRRRAVAIAIDLERTHDHLQQIIGHAMPLGARIAGLSSSTARPSRLSLPATLDDAALDRIILERTAALEALRPLFDREELRGEPSATAALGLMEQALALGGSEQRPEAIRRAVVRIADPRSWAGDNANLRDEICRTADAPETAKAPAPVVVNAWRPAEPPADAYAIDVMTDGLLTLHGVDRAALYAELRILASGKGLHARDAASPALRSNTLPALRGLGQEFPPAVFRLRGQSFDAVSIRLRIAHPGGNADWTYVGGNQPVLSTEDMLRGVRVDGFHLQPLGAALGDPGFHPALSVQLAERRMPAEGGPVRTILTLVPRFTHLEVPDADVPERPLIEPARSPGEEQAEELRLRAAIADLLYVHDLHGRFRLERQKVARSPGYEIVVGEQMAPNPLHRYLLSEDDASNARALSARIDEIAVLVRAAQEERTAQMSLRAAREEARLERAAIKALKQKELDEEMARRRADERQRREIGIAQAAERRALIERLSVPAMWARNERTVVILDAFGTPEARAHRDCARIDAMAATICAGDWRKPGRARLNRAKASVQEGVFAIDSALFGDIAYRKIGVERQRGSIVNIHGEFVIPKRTTQEWIDSKRDGRVSDVFAWSGDLGQCQIIRMHQAEDGIHVVVRLTTAPAND